MSLLLTREEVAHACNLSDTEVFNAMMAGGYTEKLWGTTFLGMNPNGSFVYEITYESHEDGEDATGRVYLKFVRGAMSKDYYLAGDY